MTSADVGKLHRKIGTKTRASAPQRRPDMHPEVHVIEFRGTGFTGGTNLFVHELIDEIRNHRRRAAGRPVVWYVLAEPSPFIYRSRSCRINHKTLQAFLSIQVELQMLIAMAGRSFETPQAAAADHWPIVNALATRDVGKTTATITEHIKDSWRRLVESYEHQNPSPNG